MGILLQLFGGRGGGSGGSRSGGGTGNGAKLTPEAAASGARYSNVMGTEYSPEALSTFFATATPAQADALLSELRSFPQGEGENNTDVQRVLNAIGWADRTPTVLDEAAWQSAWNDAGNPQRLYHADSPYNGVGARQFAKQYMGERVDASGNMMRHYASQGVFGDGTYFADSAFDSASYGSSQFRVFFNTNANSIGVSALTKNMFTYSSNHPGFKRFMSEASAGYGGKGDTSGLRSIFAVMTGHNIIDNGAGYLVVLDRSATTVSRRTMPTSGVFDNW